MYIDNRRGSAGCCLKEIDQKFFKILHKLWGGKETLTHITVTTSHLLWESLWILCSIILPQNLHELDFTCSHSFWQLVSQDILVILPQTTAPNSEEVTHSRPIC